MWYVNGITGGISILVVYERYFARGNCGFEESFRLSPRLYFCICYRWLITSDASTEEFPFLSFPLWIKMADPRRDGLYFSPPGGAWFIYLRAVCRGRDRDRNRNRGDEKCARDVESWRKLLPVVQPVQVSNNR